MPRAFSQTVTREAFTYDSGSHFAQLPFIGWTIGSTRTDGGIFLMALMVETKDCTALSDAEIEEMADLIEDEPVVFDVGELSKQRDAWVLVTQVRDGNKLSAYGFCTLERVGGDPTVLIGLAAVKRTSRRESALKAMITDQMRRAVLAFPDEDVLVAAQMADPAAFDAYKPLSRVVPRPGYEANGEDRAWGRRLAKRFEVRGEYKAKEFRVYGEGLPSLVLSHNSSKPESIKPEVIALFEGHNVLNGDALVTFGWATREKLAKLL